MLNDLLKERNIPQLKSCEEMLDILLREEYGYIPDKPSAISFNEEDNYIPNFCAGKAISKKVTIKTKICDKIT